MGRSDQIKLFEDKKIRTAWDEETEECFFNSRCSCRSDRQPKSSNLLAGNEKCMKGEGN